MAKEDYQLRKVSKHTAATILLTHHYLKDISKGFKSGYNYGLFKGTVLVGIIIFTGFPVPELVKGLFGLERNDQNGFFELSRLCLIPEVQSGEHNLASWFVSKSIRLLKNETYVRAILSYADSEFHQGTVYKACNFKYYGLTSARSDFWVRQASGAFTKQSRGKTKGIIGEWRKRSRKHRFLLVYDKTLVTLWKENIFINSDDGGKKNGK